VKLNSVVFAIECVVDHVHVRDERSQRQFHKHSIKTDIRLCLRSTNPTRCHQFSSLGKAQGHLSSKWLLGFTKTHTFTDYVNLRSVFFQLCVERRKLFIIEVVHKYIHGQTQLKLDPLSLRTAAHVAQDQHCQAACLLLCVFVWSQCEKIHVPCNLPVIVLTGKSNSYSTTIFVSVEY